MRRKIEELGLPTVYEDRADVRIFCGKLNELAFLLVDKVRDGDGIVVGPVESSRGTAVTIS